MATDADSAGASQPVPDRPRARRASSERRFRARRLREWAKDSFWVIPTLFLVVAVAVAFALRAIDDALAVAPGGGPWWVGTRAAASDILATIATAILTFLGVVFSITLVALQLASQQFSPRVTRTFVRATTTKLALGTFIATFVVSLLALTNVSQGSDEATHVPVASVTSSLLLVGASLVVFIVFVNSTTRLIRIAHIVAAVADETRRAIAENYPPERRYVTVSGNHELDLPARIVSAGEGWSGLGRGRRSGVVLGIDAGRLVELAARHDCVLRLVPRIGEYVAEDAPLVEVHGHGSPTPIEIRRGIQLGRERTLYQDPIYGIRQLVDIAIQALSQAINAPTTAVQVVDRLADLLGRIAHSPDPTGLVVDRDGRLRLVVPVRSWPEIVTLAFTEIRTFGAGSPQVTRRVVAALHDLVGELPAERHEPLREQLALLTSAVAREGAEAAASHALAHDRMGLG